MLTQFHEYGVSARTKYRNGYEDSFFVRFTFLERRRRQVELRTTDDSREVV